MKRSEAIQKLLECEWNLSNEEYTEKLLDFIVNELGMLPPETRNFRLPPEMNRYSLADELARYSVYGYRGPYAGMHYDINEWEPENE